MTWLVNDELIQTLCRRSLFVLICLTTQKIVLSKYRKCPYFKCFGNYIVKYTVQTNWSTYKCFGDVMSDMTQS